MRNINDVLNSMVYTGIPSRSLSSLNKFINSQSVHFAFFGHEQTFSSSILFFYPYFTKEISCKLPFSHSTYCMAKPFHMQCNGSNGESWSTFQRMPDFHLWLLASTDLVFDYIISVGISLMLSSRLYLFFFLELIQFHLGNWLLSYAHML